jgi:hypothetical protein
METFEEKGKQLSLIERRQWPRLECGLTVDCSAGGNCWSCEIIDLSDRGMGIFSSVKLQEGDILTIEDPSTTAQVLWTADGRAGLGYLDNEGHEAH